jgi:LuxR family maltose regulon positive regulatory protein
MDHDSDHRRTARVSNAGAPSTLHPPHIQPDCLVRERLLRELDKGIDGALTLVTAPAGFGKSTLLAQWAASAPMPVAWVGVREQRADPRALFSAITAVVQRLFPASPTLLDSASLLKRGARAPERYFASTLIRELREAPEEFILVIDDFHLVSEKVVLDFAMDLVYEAAGAVHLVLSSRADPSLPIERLRVGGELTEIRASALQFTFDEVEDFITMQLGERTSRAVAGEAMARTEGWITGLRLAILSIQADPRPDQLLLRLRASGGQHVMAYLVAEVLAQQPPYIQTFLLRTSLLDQFTGDLCDAVAASGELEGPEHEHETLAEVERRNLFLTRVDDQGERYRYHALFQQFLQRELVARFGLDESTALHRKASEWYARHGMIDDALLHAISANDYVNAGRLIEGAMEKALNEQRWRDLERWLKLLPDAVIQSRPALLIAQAVIHAIQQRLRAIPPLLRRATQLLREDADTALPLETLYGISDVLWAQDLYFKSESAKGARVASRAVEALPSASAHARGSAIMWSALLKQMAGEGEDAAQKLERLIDSDESPSVTTRALRALCVIARYAGRLESCHAAAERLLAYAQRHHLPLDMSWAHHFLGWAAYERNRLDEARDHLLAVSEQRYFANTRSACDSLSLLALTFQAQGRATEAEEALQDLNQYAVELNHTYALAAVAALRARLALTRNDLLTARAMYPWLNRPASPPTPMLWIFPPSLTQARILISSDDEDSWRAASERLGELERFALAIHDQWRIYIVRSLLAVARFRLGQRTEALKLAKETLSAALSERLVRSFADCGPEYAHILRLVRLQSLPVALAQYIDEILLASANPHEALPPPEAAPEPEAIASTQSHLASPLTAREIEVLLMLDQRWTDKEIAQALVISTFTVQTHTRSIYRKLDVRDRRQAAQKARALGFVHQANALLMRQL